MSRSQVPNQRVGQSEDSLILIPGSAINYLGHPNFDVGADQIRTDWISNQGAPYEPSWTSFFIGERKCVTSARVANPLPEGL